MSLTRNTAGLILKDDFATLAGWTAPAEWTVDTTRPLYVAYTSDVAMLTGGSVGSADGSGPREGHLMQVSDSLWYLFYGAGDGNNSGSGAPWRPQLAKSTNRGVSWTKLGSIAGITNGSYAARDFGGFVWYESGTYYMHILNADTQSNGIPGINYRNAIYTATDPEGTWSFQTETPSLGGAGSFDEVSVNVTWVEKIGATYHAYWSSRYLSISGTAWGVGHGTQSSPTGAITKDGLGSFLPTSVTGVSVSMPENGKKWYSSALGKYILACNTVNSSSSFTDGNDCFYSTNQTDFSTCYRSRLQQANTSYDGVNAVGLICPFVAQGGAAVDINGYVPFTWDADPPSTFNGGDNTDGYHRGRKIRQGVLEPAATSARLATSASAKLAIKAQTNSNFIAEVAVEFEASATSNSFGLCYRMDQNNGDTYRGYVLQYNHTDQKFNLYKNNNGSYSLVGQAAVGPGRDIDNNNIGVQRWKIVVSGSSHQLYLNGDASPTLNLTDGTYTSGSYIGLRGECATRVRLLALRSSDSVTVTGLTPGQSAVLRGHGGVIAATATADGSGVATLSNKHFPLHSIDIAGVNHVPADGGMVWGGDSFSVAGAAPTLSALSASNITPTGARHSVTLTF